jgi:hypothetical protein
MDTTAAAGDEAERRSSMLMMRLLLPIGAIVGDNITTPREAAAVPEMVSAYSQQEQPI